MKNKEASSLGNPNLQIANELTTSIADTVIRKTVRFYHLFSQYSQKAYISLTSTFVPSSRIAVPFQIPWT